MKRPIVRARHLVAVFLLIKWSELTQHFCKTCAPREAIPAQPEDVMKILVELGYEPLCDLVFHQQNWNTSLENVLQQLRVMDPKKKVNPRPYLRRLWLEVSRGHSRTIQSLVHEQAAITIQRLMLDARNDRLPTSKLSLL